MVGSSKMMTSVPIERHAGDGDEFPLGQAQVVRVAVFYADKPDVAQGSRGLALFRFIGRDTQVERPEHDLVDDPAFEKLIRRILKDKPDRVGLAPPTVVVAGVDAVNEHVAAGPVSANR